MTARRRVQRVAPEPPDLPAVFQKAPAAVVDGAMWDEVEADSTLRIPERVADVRMLACVWRGVSAGSRRFDGLDCRDTVFELCDFSGAVLDGAELTRVRFINCRLTGAVFSAGELNDVVIENGVARLANFRMSSSSFLWISGASLQEADFYDARLRHSSLLDCDLTGADFTKAHVQGLNLHGSVVDSVRGATSLSAADVRIDASQVGPLGAAVLGELGVRISQRPDDLS